MNCIVNVKLLFPKDKFNLYLHHISISLICAMKQFACAFAIED